MITRWVSRTFLALLCTIVCAPLAYILVTSLVTTANTNFPLTVAGYQVPDLTYFDVLFLTPEFHIMFWNTCCLTAATIAAQIIIAIPAAWVFSRWKTHAGRLIFALYILLMLLPFQATILPNYLALNRLAMLDSLPGVILISAFNTLPVFIIEHFFSSIPRNTVESALIDGASEFRILLEIGIPTALPGIIAALVLSIFELWNMIEQPLAFLHSQALWPLSMYLPNMSYGALGTMCAIAILSAIPSLLVFLACEKQLEQGISTLMSRD